MGEKTLIGQIATKAVEQAALVATVKRYQWAAGFLLPAIPLLWLAFQFVSQVYANEADIQVLIEHHQRTMELPK